MFWSLKPDWPLASNPSNTASDGLTFDEDRSEAALLHGSVRHELDVHLVGGRLDVAWHAMPAELAQKSRVVLVPVAHLHVVVDAVVVVLHLQQRRRRRRQIC